MEVTPELRCAKHPGACEKYYSQLTFNVDEVDGGKLTMSGGSGVSGDGMVYNGSTIKITEIVDPTASGYYNPSVVDKIEVCVKIRECVTSERSPSCLSGV